MKKSLKIISLIMTSVLVFAMISCAKEENKAEDDGLPNFVCIEFKDYGKMIIELYPDMAPKTVANFKKLVNKGFYDGLTIHRIDKKFVIQGGDPNGNGTGGSGETIYGEFEQNGFKKNTLKHEKGVISMARQTAPNTATSQFFIVTETSERNSDSLDGKYAGFGKIINDEGFEVLDKIANVKVKNEKPQTPVIMERVSLVENPD